ncbi:hypothetical protein [Leptolyngbya ohadii]|nr:hypothetical protein [Leptolyngbya ohadii]
MKICILLALLTVLLTRYRGSRRFVRLMLPTLQFVEALVVITHALN